jgi:hypothetical protein
MVSIERDGSRPKRWVRFGGDGTCCSHVTGILSTSFTCISVPVRDFDIRHFLDQTRRNEYCLESYRGRRLTGFELMGTAVTMTGSSAAMGGPSRAARSRYHARPRGGAGHSECLSTSRRAGAHGNDLTVDQRTPATPIRSRHT